MAGGVRSRRQAPPARASAFAQAAQSASLTARSGKTALEARYRSGVVLAGGFVHTESVDLDGEFRSSEPNAHRWDYGIGVRHPAGVEMAFWIEPHPASSTSDVDTMLAKLRWLRSKLDSPAFRKLRALRDAAQGRGSPYRWLVSPGGSVHITPQSREARRIALEGLDPPQRRVTLP